VQDRKKEEQKVMEGSEVRLVQYFRLSDDWDKQLVWQLKLPV
jgi:hypothetical protein